MAETSSVPVVIEQLKSLLASRAATLQYQGHGAEVYDGYPARDAGWSYYAIGDITNWDREIQTLKAGRKHRQETYAIEVRVSCTRPGQQPTAARTAAIEMIDEIDDLIADNPGLDLETTYPTLVTEVMDGRLNTTVDETSQGWRCTIDVMIATRVRLK